MLTHLADISIRSLLLAAIAANALLILRSRRSPALQHAVWTAVVLGMLALFTLGETLPRLPLRVLNPTPSGNNTTETIAANESFIPLPELSARPAPTTAPHSNIDWTTLATDLYAIIAAAFAIRFLLGMLLVRRLLAQSTPIDGFRESELIGIPVTAGWLRPVIVLPKEWRDWDEAKLEAVLTHERAHVRRKDGLIAALAGLNRCLLWFNPLAWWLERRLALLAEQACDEASILALGGSEDDREEYVRLLLDMAATLNTSHGRLRTHVLAMASRSQIRQRVEPLLQYHRAFSRGLNKATSIALAICCIPVVWAAGGIDLARQAAQLHLDVSRFTIAIPQVPEQKPQLVAWAQAQSQRPAAQSAPEPEAKFDAASIKPSEITQAGGRGGNTGRLEVTPGRVFGRRLTTRQIILEAYHNLTEYQISGGPSWLDLDTFDLEARTEVATDTDQIRAMLRTLLAERFRLIVRSEKKEMPVYALTVAKSALGPQINPINKEDPDPPTEKIREMLGKNHASAGRGTINIIRGNMEEFAHRLSGLYAIRQSDVPAIAAHAGMDPLSVITGPPIGRPVIDKTGLKGDYFVVLGWNFDEDVKSLLEEELGLKLVPEKALVDTLALDHIEKPNPN